MGNNEFNFYQQGVAELQDYLLSDELFWNLSGQDRLTIGGLLFARRRLDHFVFPGGEWDLIRSMDLKIQEIKGKWRVAWDKKVKWEISSRLRLWSEYLADYWNSPDEFSDAYSQEVKKRVILQLLENELGGTYPEKRQLTLLDSHLRASLLPGNFIWQDDQVENFNDSDYWFLYGRLKAN